jgi:hypothetical protein
MKTVPLTRGYMALVDDADYESVSAHKWCARVDRRRDGTIRSVYAGRTAHVAGKKIFQSLHRYILGLGNSIMAVDHVNHNGLDNRRENLRLATYSQNAANNRKRRNTSSRYKGVRWHRATEKWEARIGVAGKLKYLGLFTSEEAAALAYAEAASKAFGEFANV